MRIAALGQLQQQLVQIEPAHEPIWRKIGDRAIDFRRHQLTGLRRCPTRTRACAGTAAARPSSADFGTVGAAREQREPSMLAGEHLHDAAGVAIGILVQDVGRCQPYAPPGWPAARSSQRVVPKLAQRHFAVGPVFLDLDPQLQMHRALPQIVELDARQAADLLQAARRPGRSRWPSARRARPR